MNIYFQDIFVINYQYFDNFYDTIKFIYFSFGMCGLILPYLHMRTGWELRRNPLPEGPSRVRIKLSPYVFTSRVDP